MHYSPQREKVEMQYLQLVQVGLLMLSTTATLAEKKALALSKSFDVNINYQVATIESFPFERKQYDLIALFFVHLPPELRRQLHSSCVNALRPGGKHLLEGFHTSQLGLNSGGPKAINMLFSLPDLEEDFTALKIDLITHQSVILNEGAYHNGPAETERIIATK